jgi:hypothetical protein
LKSIQEASHFCCCVWILGLQPSGTVARSRQSVNWNLLAQCRSTSDCYVEKHRWKTVVTVR